MGHAKAIDGRQQKHKRLCLQRGSCCEVCGILAHEGCARHVPDDCRPIALPAEQVLHTWKAAGTVLVENEVRVWLIDSLAHACLGTSHNVKPAMLAPLIFWVMLSTDSVLLFERWA